MFQQTEQLRVELKPEVLRTSQNFSSAFFFLLDALLVLHKTSLFNIEHQGRQITFHLFDDTPQDETAPDGITWQANLSSSQVLRDIA